MAGAELSLITLGIWNSVSLIDLRSSAIITFGMTGWKSMFTIIRAIKLKIIRKDIFENYIVFRVVVLLLESDLTAYLFVIYTVASPVYISMLNMQRECITKSDYVRRKRRALIRKTFYIMQYQFENEQQARNTT